LELAAVVGAAAPPRGGSDAQEANSTPSTRVEISAPSPPRPSAAQRIDSGAIGGVHAKVREVSKEMSHHARADPIRGTHARNGSHACAI
jgi:hypothetical protein